MKLVIISGQPAAGKSTLAKELSRRLGYELYSKDQIKEQLFDTESKTTHNYTWYERKAKRQLFKKVEEHVRSETSLIIESNFIRNDKKYLKPYLALGKKVHIVELYCTAKGFTRIKRYIARNERGKRHKGHHDRRWYVAELLETSFSYLGTTWPYSPLNISDIKLVVDGTDFDHIPYKSIAEFVRKA